LIRFTTEDGIERECRCYLTTKTPKRDSTGVRIELRPCLRTWQDADVHPGHRVALVPTDGYSGGVHVHRIERCPGCVKQASIDSKPFAAAWKARQDRDELKRRQREWTRRSRARKRGEDVPVVRVLGFPAE
jgi:hypothetical protein